MEKKKIIGVLLLLNLLLLAIYVEYPIFYGKGAIENGINEWHRKFWRVYYWTVIYSPLLTCLIYMYLTEVLRQLRVIYVIVSIGYLFYYFWQVYVCLHNSRYIKEMLSDSGYSFKMLCVILLLVLTILLYEHRKTRKNTLL
jgi:hypothetical protein